MKRAEHGLKADRGAITPGLGHVYAVQRDNE